jgi:homoserine kinase
MSDMSARSVLVDVPATSANLGPGFDSLGLALDWRARFRFTIAERAQRPTDVVEQMALSAAFAFYSRASLEAPSGLLVEYDGDLPVGRGLGVSAAARVAGVVAANALAGTGHTRATLLTIAVQLEGHADNATPAMLGGLQVVVYDDDGLHYLELDPPDDLRAVLLVPEFSMPTQESRRALPDRLTRNQAVHNIGRAAMLVGALSTRQYGLLNVATEDILHQPARAGIFPPMYSIFQAARDAGAHGVYLSGGGSTIAAFASERFEEIAGAMREAAAAHGHGAVTRICQLGGVGARVLEDDT